MHFGKNGTRFLNGYLPPLYHGDSYCYNTMGFGVFGWNSTNFFGQIFTFSCLNQVFLVSIWIQHLEKPLEHLDSREFTTQTCDSNKSLQFFFADKLQPILCAMTLVHKTLFKLIDLINQARCILTLDLPSLERDQIYRSAIFFLK